MPLSKMVSPQSGRSQKIEQSAPFVLALFVAFFLVTRLYNLDYDGPLFSETSYNSWLDTFAYGLKALQWYHASSYEKYQDLYSQNIPFLYLSNGVTYLSMLVFGDNFYGFRFGAVFVTCLSLVIIFNTLRYGHGLFAALIASAYLTFDYNFYIASREVEPTTFRIFEMWLTLTVVAFVIKRFGEINLIGVFIIIYFSITLVFLEYPTNIFVICAVGTFLFLIYVRGLVDFFEFVSVAILALFLGIATYLLVFTLDGDSFGIFRGLRSLFGGRIAGGDGFIAIASKNIGNIPDALFLSYIPFGWIIFALTIGYYVIRTIWRNKADLDVFGILSPSPRSIDGGRPKQLTAHSPRRGVSSSQAADIVVALIAIFLFLQTAFINDYPVRKQVIWMPIFAYALAVSCVDIARFTRFMFGRLGFAIAALPVVIFSSISAPRIIDKAVINPTFVHRDAMRSLSALDGKYFIGGFSWAFTLYNNILPIGNPYIYNKPGYPAVYRLPVIALIEKKSPDSPKYTISYGVSPSTEFRRERLLLPSREKFYKDIWLFGR